jgi:HAD superfamily hydrolase (TIGR01509 family)
MEKFRIPADYESFLFDLNGTMIDDMHYHVKAWHDILNRLGANITMEKMKEECYGKNDELLERTFPGRFSGEEKRRMSFEKERDYQAAYIHELKLIEGLDNLIREAHARGIHMAIGSAAIMFNIDFVLDNLSLRPYFSVLVSADDVSRSKPDPETFLRCATLLGSAPANCLVFEDSPKGVESAQRAGMNAIVILGSHEPREFEQFENILHMAPDFRFIELPR